MKKMMTIAAAGALVLAACGSDSGGGDSGSDAKDTLFNELMADFDEDGDTEGASVDESCIRGLVDEIPDDQAVLIANNLDADEPPEGLDTDAFDTLLTGLFGCIEIDFDAITEE